MERILIRTLTPSEMKYWELKGQVKYFNLKEIALVGPKFQSKLYFLNEESGII
jgi:hypothetical protein